MSKPWLPAVTVTVVAVVVVSALAVLYASAGGDRSKARSQLAASRAELSLAKSSLASTQSALAEAQSQLPAVQQQGRYRARVLDDIARISVANGTLFNDCNNNSSAPAKCDSDLKALQDAIRAAKAGHRGLTVPAAFQGFEASLVKAYGDADAAISATFAGVANGSLSQVDSGLNALDAALVAMGSADQKISTT